MAEGKYYWLKLKRDFFKRHDIRIIESMPNGKDYILFYLKLLLESIDHEGELRFSNTIPYNEQMLSVITNTNIDVVRSAMEVFKELKMIEVFDDLTIYMAEVDKLIGSETKGAERVRKHRENQKLLQCNTDVTDCNKSVTQSKSIEKEIKKELEQDVDVVCNGNTDLNTFEDNSVDFEGEDLFEKRTGKTFNLQYGKLGKGVVLLTDEQDEELLEKLGYDGYNHYVDKLATFIIEKNAKVSNHYATILKWAREDAMI